MICSEPAPPQREIMRGEELVGFRSINSTPFPPAQIGRGLKAMASKMHKQQACLKVKVGVIRVTRRINSTSCAPKDSFDAPQTKALNGISFPVRSRPKIENLFQKRRDRYCADMNFLFKGSRLAKIFQGILALLARPRNRIDRLSSLVFIYCFCHKTFQSRFRYLHHSLSL